MLSSHQLQEYPKRNIHIHISSSRCHHEGKANTPIIKSEKLFLKWSKTCFYLNNMSINSKAWFIWTENNPIPCPLQPDESQSQESSQAVYSGVLHPVYSYPFKPQPSGLGMPANIRVATPGSFFLTVGNATQYMVDQGDWIHSNKNNWVCLWPWIVSSGLKNNNYSKQFSFGLIVNSQKKQQNKVE